MKTKKPKTKQLHISISQDELLVIDSNAKRAAMNRSEYMRWTALNYTIEIPPIPTEALASLCNISTVLNQNSKLDIKQTQLFREEFNTIWQSLNL